MGGRVTTERAGEVYAKRHGRPWQGDGSLGLLLAMSMVIREQWARLVRFRNRRRVGLPAEEPASPPAWFARHVDAYRDKLARAPLDRLPPVYRVLADPAMFELLDDLRSGDGIAATLLTPEVLAAADAELARLADQRARDEVLYVFFVGVRITFFWVHRAEPSASQLALIAAAAGIVPLEPSLTAQSKRWRDRLRLWRPEMDRTPWQTLVAEHPHCPIFDAALPG